LTNNRRSRQWLQRRKVTLLRVVRSLEGSLRRIVWRFPLPPQQRTRDAANALNIPNAVDIDVLAIKPAVNSRLQSPAGRHAALERFYEDNGYLFFAACSIPTPSPRPGRDAGHCGRPFHWSKKATERALDRKPLEGWSEESPLFAGISRRLVEHPTTRAAG
jgi:hypothetical protein